MPTATVTSKGQVTIPKQVRQHLHLGAGDRVEFVVQEAGTVLLRSLDRSVQDLFDLLPRSDRPAPTLAEIDESILKGRIEDDERVRARK